MNLTTTDRPRKSKAETFPQSSLPDPPDLPEPFPSPQAIESTDNARPSALLDHIETSVDKFTERKRKARAMSNRFKSIEGLENKGRKIGQCSQLIIKRAFSCGHNALIRNAGEALAFRCKERLCPICDHARSVKLSNKLGSALKSYVHAHGLHTYHLTLTFKNTEELPDYKKIRTMAKRLFDSKSKARKAFWSRYGFHGAIMNFETTVKKTGFFHPHFHVLLVTEKPIELIEFGEHEGEFQNSVNQELSDLWYKITKDSFVLKGVSFQFDHMFEMVKYMTKGVSNIPDRQLHDLVKWSEGKRFLSMIGDLYCNEELKGLINSDGEEHDPETCAECGCNEFVDIPMMYNWHMKRYEPKAIAYYGCNMERPSYPP